MTYDPQGKKEVIEAVTIAALGAVATGLINWGLEVAKERAKAKKAAPEPEKTP